MNTWWLGLPPAQTTVTCAGQEHRLRWDAGALRALDHDDPSAERTLAAIGGERCACIDVLDAWDAHTDDLRALVLAGRGPTDQLTAQDNPAARPGVFRPQIVATPAARRRGRRATMASASRGAAMQTSGWTSYGPPGPASKQADAEQQLFTLLGLGGGLPDRLLATVAATWRDRLGQPDRAAAQARPQLHAALHGRVLAAMRGWLGQAGLKSEVKMVPEGKQPRLALDDGVARAQLPFGWLVDTWAKGLATTWGRFCIEATTEDGTTWSLQTIAPDFGPAEVINLSLDPR